MPIFIHALLFVRCARSFCCAVFLFQCSTAAAADPPVYRCTAAYAANAGFQHQRTERKKRSASVFLSLFHVPPLSYVLQLNFNAIYGTICLCLRQELCCVRCILLIQDTARAAADLPIANKKFAAGKFLFCRLSGKKFAVGQRDTCRRQTFHLPTAN